jgi:hypothetical protein
MKQPAIETDILQVKIGIRSDILDMAWLYGLPDIQCVTIFSHQL